VLQSYSPDPADQFRAFIRLRVGADELHITGEWRSPIRESMCSFDLLDHVHSSRNGRRRWVTSLGMGTYVQEDIYYDERALATTKPVR
jgi:hypothetical protein